MCNACNGNNDHDFSSIPDGLSDDELGLAISGPKVAIDTRSDVVPVFHTEICKSCRGSGAFHSYAGRYVGPCFKCKGKGKIAYKTDSATRAKGRERAVANKLNAAQLIADQVESFKVAQPVVWEWMANSSFPFAIAMRDALQKYGDLTPKQLESATRCALKAIEWKRASAIAQAERVANAPSVDVSKLVAAFAHAALTLKNPRMELAGFKITRAKDHSKNPGALYFKANGLYLGKVANGAFVKSKDCTDAQEREAVMVCNDPKAAAIAYGLKFGICSCCGRELTNPASVAAGIGPICAGKFGF